MEPLLNVKGGGPDIEVVVVTAFGTVDHAVAAMKGGAYDYLTKPFEVDEIAPAIERALEKRALVDGELELPRRQVEAAIAGRSLGESQPMPRRSELIGSRCDGRTPRC